MIRIRKTKKYNFVALLSFRKNTLRMLQNLATFLVCTIKNSFAGRQDRFMGYMKKCNFRSEHSSKNAEPEPN